MLTENFIEINLDEVEEEEEEVSTELILNEYKKYFIFEHFLYTIIVTLCSIYLTEREYKKCETLYNIPFACTLIGCHDFFVIKLLIKKCKQNMLELLFFDLHMFVVLSFIIITTYFSNSVNYCYHQK